MTMARSYFLTSCLIWTGCLLSMYAYAATIEIGRTSVELPAGAWKQVASSDGEILLDAGINGRIPTDDRAYAFMEGERVLAILLISSSKGAGGATLKWTHTC